MQQLREKQKAVGVTFNCEACCADLPEHVKITCKYQRNDDLKRHKVVCSKIREMAQLFENIDESEKSAGDLLEGELITDYMNYVNCGSDKI